MSLEKFETCYGRNLAIVKQLGPRRDVEKGKRANAHEYKGYLEKGLMDGMEAHTEGCSANWVEDFQLTAELHHKLSNNVAIEYVQSWSPEESQRMGPEVLFQVGIESAREMYPNTQFIVVPQVGENGNYHNHILFNAVDSVSGERHSSTFTERKRMTKLTDERCLALGLSIPDRSKVSVGEKLSNDAHRQVRSKKYPQQLQVMKRADVARTYASNMKDFVEIMLSFGIRVEDRGKVLTFHHPLREQGIRDRQLGLNYTKEGLNAQFTRNERNYNERPGLKAALRDQVERFDNVSGNFMGNAGEFPFAPGGHQKFERRLKGELGAGGNGPRMDVAGNSHHEPSYGFLARHIAHQNGRNIAEYCKQHRIPLVEYANGTHRLRDRAHILLEGNTWRNTKPTKNGNTVGTTGGLVDFVTLHKGISAVEALHELTGNKRFLELLSHFGKPEAPYKEFHMPKALEPLAIQVLDAFARKMKLQSGWSRAVLNSKRVEVTTSSAIRFLFGKGEGAVEHKQNANGKWLKKQLGVLRGGLISQEGSSPTAKVFSDPFAFMEATKGKGKMGFKSSDSFLVLGDSNDRSLDFFLAANAHVKKVEMIGFPESERTIDRFQLAKGQEIKFEFMEVNSGGKSPSLKLEI